MTTENSQLKQHVDESIVKVEARCEHFRNLATAIYMDKNVKLEKEVDVLHTKMEELEQYGRRTSLTFHNVPMSHGDLQKTDDLVVAIVNDKLKLTPPLCKDDINRSHIIGEIKKW